MPADLPHANAPEWELRLALGFVLVQAMKKSAPIEALPFGWTAEFDLLVADTSYIPRTGGCYVSRPLQSTAHGACEQWIRRSLQFWPIFRRKNPECPFS